MMFNHYYKAVIYEKVTYVLRGYCLGVRREGRRKEKSCKQCLM